LGDSFFLKIFYAREKTATIAFPRKSGIQPISCPWRVGEIEGSGKLVQAKGGAMKRIICSVVVAIVLATVVIYAQGSSTAIKTEDCFFLTSLHFTAEGMRYWYSKEQGGLEKVSGIPYTELACRNCHVAGCDSCHKVESKEKDTPVLAYSVESARSQNMCLKCHGREAAMMKVNEKQQQQDVHVLQGMQCVDCHSTREMHGDGVEYISMKQPGAMTTRCENCHEDIQPTEAHTVHGGKLDCKACHLRHVVSCMNCHFDTMVKEGVRKAMPVSGWLFLMNYEGKVTAASTQSFVAKGKTFLMFAPHMSHAVMKEGRACDGCHGTEAMQQAKEGKVRLTWLENEQVVNLKAVIPVVDSVDYVCTYHDFKDGKWPLINQPPEPGRQYVGYGKPLNEQQLQSLNTVQTPSQQGAQQKSP